MYNFVNRNKVIEQVALDFCDVTLVPVQTPVKSRSDVILKTVYDFNHTDFKFNRVPVFVANMDTVGTIKVHESLYNTGICVALHKYVTLDQYKVHFAKHLNVDPSSYAVTIGCKESDLEFLEQVFEHTNAELVCVDVANGYMEHFVDFIKVVRAKFPTKVIIAGNVCTSDGATALAVAGANIIKVGIGSGAMCLTRSVAGTGVPQLSAVLEVCERIQQYNRDNSTNVYVMSDGGCNEPGDFAKAFAAGAEFVMAGGFFAGHDESGLISYGMSSTQALQNYHKGIESHRASEGKTLEFKKSKGSVVKTAELLLGGLNSACSYQGVTELKEISLRAVFRRVNRVRNTFYDSITSQT